MPSQIDQRPSRSTFFWFLGSKLKGKAVADLLHIAAARLMKSIAEKWSYDASWAIQVWKRCMRESRLIHE